MLRVFHDVTEIASDMHRRTYKLSV